MRAFTHLSAGFLAGFISYTYLGETSLALVTIALLGSILPDIDLPFSMLGKMPIWLKLFVRHRGPTHSLLFLIVVAALFLIFMGIDYAIAYSAGGLTHLFLDALNPSGVPLAWPLPLRTKGRVKYALYNDLMLSGAFITITGILWLLL